MVQCGDEVLKDHLESAPRNALYTVAARHLGQPRGTAPVVFQIRKRIQENSSEDCL